MEEADSRQGCLLEVLGLGNLEEQKKVHGLSKGERGTVT